MNIQSRKRIVSISVFIGLTVINILIIMIFKLEDFSFSSKSFAISIIFSTIYALLHIFICIILRIKRRADILKGIFIYQLIGCISFLILFAGLLQGNKIKLFDYIFRWWALPYEPLSIIFSLFRFFPQQIILAIIYYLTSYITGNSILQIKKDISFEKKLTEKKALEEESLNRMIKK